MVTAGVLHGHRPRHPATPPAFYAFAIDSADPSSLDPTVPRLDEPELPDELPPPTAEDIQPDSFVVTTGFLRAGDDPARLPVGGAGPTYTEAEADRAAHEFFAALAGDRELEQRLDDPVEHVRANGLMLLFSEGVAELFETHLARMAPAQQARWRDLIAGGARSEAFGPLTLEERLDERQVEAALVAGRRQRWVNLGLTSITLVVLAGLGWWAWATFGAGETRTRGALQFALLDETDSPTIVTGGAPIAEGALTVPLIDTVAVEAGDGPPADRIATAPFSAYRFPPGSLAASLFAYGGTGQVVVVGPSGFVDEACLRVSVVTSDLRPLDTVTTGPCADPVGRRATVGCTGSSAVLVALRIPAGEVTLPEGGTGFADAIRVQYLVDDPTYDVLSVRATIAVDPDSGVTIPAFGGTEGDELVFDLGAGRVGTCTLTGETDAVS